MLNLSRQRQEKILQISDRFSLTLTLTLTELLILPPGLHQTLDGK